MRYKMQAFKNFFLKMSTGQTFSALLARARRSFSLHALIKIRTLLSNKDNFFIGG